MRQVPNGCVCDHWHYSNCPELPSAKLEFVCILSIVSNGKLRFAYSVEISREWQEDGIFLQNLQFSTGMPHIVTESNLSVISIIIVYCCFKLSFLGLTWLSLHLKVVKELTKSSSLLQLCST